MKTFPIFDKFHFFRHWNRKANYKTDRFAAFFEFLEYFNEKSLQHMAPGDYLSLDETLYGMRNQICFEANKPHKYGLLFQSINAARLPYNFCCIPYSGKPENKTNFMSKVQRSSTVWNDAIVVIRGWPKYIDEFYYLSPE